MDFTSTIVEMLFKIPWSVEFTKFMKTSFKIEVCDRNPGF